MRKGQSEPVQAAGREPRETLISIGQIRVSALGDRPDRTEGFRREGQGLVVQLGPGSLQRHDHGSVNTVRDDQGSPDFRIPCHRHPQRVPTGAYPSE